MDQQANTGVLNDLIKINNDRILGYQKAIDQLGDEDRDIKLLFTNMVSESQHFNRELTRLAIHYGGDVSTTGTASGRLYRTWTDVKAVFTGGNRKAVLDNCEMGEDAALKAYEAALEEKDLTPDARELILRQQGSLQLSHEKIKRTRDGVEIITGLAKNENSNI